MVSEVEEKEENSMEESEKQLKEKTKTIMVAVEESQESSYALQWALKNLFVGTSNDEQIRLIIVHCQGEIALAAQFAFAPHVLEVLERRMRTNSEKVLSAAKAICEEHLKYLKVETKSVKGDARYAICEAAETEMVDLLVVGNRGHGAIRRAVIGSVSNYCAHHAKCPVLIVKRQI